MITFCPASTAALLAVQSDGKERKSIRLFTVKPPVVDQDKAIDCVDRDVSLSYVRVSVHFMHPCARLPLTSMISYFIRSFINTYRTKGSKVVLFTKCWEDSSRRSIMLGNRLCARHVLSCECLSTRILNTDKTAKDG